MIVVGAIVAATMSMPGAAGAAHYRGFHSRAAGYAARMPRRAATGLRRVRPAWGHAFAARGLRFARPARGAAYDWHRGYAWHRAAARQRVATAAQPAPTPFAGLLPFSAPTPEATAPAAAHAVSGGQTGRASFYGGRGRTAAGGHVGAATCAHRSLPFGTRVLVTNLANARSAVLTVNDRGPFVAGRVVDVSVGAAGTLGMLHSGTAPVRVQVIGGPG